MLFTREMWPKTESGIDDIRAIAIEIPWDSFPPVLSLPAARLLGQCASLLPTPPRLVQGSSLDVRLRLDARGGTFMKETHQLHDNYR